MKVSGSRRYRDRALRVQEGGSHETQYGNYSKYSAHLTFEDGEVSKSNLLCQAIADDVTTSLLSSGATSNQGLLFWLVEQRDSLARRCIKVGIFLFSTLALLALVMFGQATDFSLMGIKIEDSTFFCVYRPGVGESRLRSQHGLIRQRNCVRISSSEPGEEGSFPTGR